MFSCFLRTDLDGSISLPPSLGLHWFRSVYHTFVSSRRMCYPSALAVMLIDEWDVYGSRTLTMSGTKRNWGVG